MIGMKAALAVSSGDPSGIGPDIALAAWILRKHMQLPAFFLLADAELIASRAVLHSLLNYQRKFYRGHVCCLKTLSLGRK